MKKLSGNIFALCVFLTLSSCHARKFVIIENAETEEKESIYGLEELIGEKRSFKTLKVKRMNIDFKINGQSENLKGNMAINRDSLIVISIIPVLGYEVLRVMCTRDSIIVINRPEKTYNASSLGYYLNKYNIPLKFADIQAALSNEMIYYQPEIDGRNFTRDIKMEREQVRFTIDSFREGEKLTKQRVQVDSGNMCIRSVFIIDYERKIQLDLNYNDFKDFEKVMFPKKLGINILDEKNIINLDIKYGLIIFDESIDVKFEPPDNYSRIDI